MMKKLFTTAVLLFAAVPVLAQGPPPGPHGGPGPGGPALGPGAPAGPQQPQGPAPEVVLKEALGFTDAQLTAFQGLVQARQQSAEALSRQLGEAHKALGDALNASEPDAATVGARLLAVRGLEKQMAAIADAFRTGFEGLLTGDQKTKLQQLYSVADAVRAADALHRLGI